MTSKSMTIHEFSRIINLSSGTISRALNDRPEVSAETRRYVLEKARELGFSRSSLAVWLATSKTFLILLECPHKTGIVPDRYLIDWARANDRSLNERGYNLILRLGARRNDETLTVFKNVDGVLLIAATETSAADIESLANQGRTPVVVICNPEQVSYPGASYISVDICPGIAEALGHLIACGHSRIGYIGTGISGHSVRVALSRFITDAGLPWGFDLAVETNNTQDDGYRSALYLMDRPDRPTAIFAQTDLLAAGAIQAAQSRGLSVPGDVSVVSHEETEIATLTNPQLSTVAIDVQQIGALAISTLLSMIEQQATPTVQTIPTRLVVRRSTGPRRESSTNTAGKMPPSSREQADPPARKRGRPPRVPITT